LKNKALYLDYAIKFKKKNIISKEVIIPMAQAKKLYAKTATGNEYAEFMSQNSSK
jgi:hypothetical protein